jgi:hypothetical protein
MSVATHFMAGPLASAYLFFGRIYLLDVDGSCVMMTQG